MNPKPGASQLQSCPRVLMVRTTMSEGENSHGTERARLVRSLAEQSRVTDTRILAAFRAVPRHRFVPADLEPAAYEDRALPIGQGQTISQPTMIAEMLVELAPKPSDRALEVGAGSGYAAALLSTLVAEVHAVEVLPTLAEKARATLASLGHVNVSIVTGDGRLGLPDLAPFDVILVSAFARSVPEALLAQLAPGGRLAI